MIDNIDYRQSEAEEETFSRNGYSNSISEEQRILNLIFLNDVPKLKVMKLQTRNLNFLEEFKEVDIDSKITPLICAASLGRLECVKILLSNKEIDVNMTTQPGRFTPIGVACATGNLEILKILLEHGADVNKEACEQPPLTYCFTRLQEETNAFENQLICMKMAESLLQRGANIDAIVDKDKGYTLLMQFCAIKIELTEFEKLTNKKVIKFLLEQGADRQLRSRKGKTPYELAENHCNKEEVRKLLDTVKQKYYYESPATTASDVPRKKKWLIEESSWNPFCTKFKWC